MTTAQRIRASSALLAGLSLAAACAAGVAVSAHRLDEYLQAARIDVRDDGVAIELALTPGAEIADSIVSLIDRDRDGAASAGEQHVYAAGVAGALQVRVDGATLPLRLTEFSFPTIEQLRRGEGIIRLEASGRHSVLSSGRHQLFFRNGYLAEPSAYLANALVPVTPRLSITGQRRTFDQRELTIEYSLGGSDERLVAGGLMVGLIAAVLVVRYRRSDMCVGSSGSTRRPIAEPVSQDGRADRASAARGRHEAVIRPR